MVNSNDKIELLTRIFISELATLYSWSAAHIFGIYRMRSICPACRQQLDVLDDLAGTPISCPACNASFVAEKTLNDDINPVARRIREERERDEADARRLKEMALTILLFPVALLNGLWREVKKAGVHG